jgi:hypothetical protein
MSLDTIKQLTKSILESSYRYESLLLERNSGRKVDKELNSIKEYIERLCSLIKKETEKERKNAPD